MKYEKGSMEERSWGPAFWFTLHNSSLYYPENPSRLSRKRMRYFLLSMSIMIPCDVCRTHAINFIDKHRGQLDNIVSCRENVFKFFVDFHNDVNKRLNRSTMSYEEAYELYSGDLYIKYE